MVLLNNVGFRYKAGISPALLLVWLLVLSLTPVACGGSSEATDEGASDDRVVASLGLCPDWNIDDMAKRSDAIIVGTVVAELGTKQDSGPYEDTSDLVNVYKDVQIDVERFIHPASATPESIAVLFNARIDSTNKEGHIHTFSPAPTLEVGDRVLLFLESLQGDKFNNPPGRPIPAGYSVEEYYQVLISESYGKLIPDGDDWKDSRSDKEVKVSDIEQAVRQQDNS
jgi:hypothetical protein